MLNSEGRKISIYSSIKPAWLVLERKCDGNWINAAKKDQPDINLKIKINITLKD
jgi:hypothetical protein